MACCWADAAGGRSLVLGSPALLWFVGSGDKLLTYMLHTLITLQELPSSLGSSWRVAMFLVLGAQGINTQVYDCDYGLEERHCGPTKRRQGAS